MACVHFSYGEPPISGVFNIDPTDGPFRITVGNKRWWFEWSERWGPLVVRRNGATAEQPGWRSPFWRAACIWAEQGKRTNLQNALWHEPPPITHFYRQIGKRNKLLVSVEEPTGSIPDYSEERWVEVSAIAMEAAAAGETPKSGSARRARARVRRTSLNLKSAQPVTMEKIDECG